jgi:murein DD-endopeptidase MepM/ murein hydrolase activator NlpD
MLSGLGLYHFHHTYGPHMPCCRTTKSPQGESLIDLFNAYGGSAWTITSGTGGQTTFVFQAMIEIEPMKFFALDITGRQIDSEFYIATGGTRTHISPLFGTSLNPRLVSKEESPWNGATGPFDLLVNADYFHELVKKHTGLERPRTNYISPYGYGNLGEITSPFAYRSPSIGTFQLHAGWDFILHGSSSATPNIYSIADGDVIANRDGAPGFGGGYGYHVIVKHEDPQIGTFCVMYAHLNERSSLQVGDSVRQGELIGRQGGTQGPGRPLLGFHLHFQTWKGDAIDYRPSSAFNPITELYGLQMTPDSIVNSGLFVLRDLSISSHYSWNRNFWNYFNRELNGSRFTQSVIDGMVTLLGFIRPA